MVKQLNKIFHLLFIKILPVKKNRVVFISYNGKYNDNSKYLFNEFKQLNNNLQYIWLLNEKTFNSMDNTDNCYVIDTLKADYYYGTASIIIDNNYGHKEVVLSSNSHIKRFYFNILKFLKYKKNQYVYTTWHGTPLKKMGRDQVNSKIIDFACDNTTMILGDKHTLKIMKHLMFDKVKCQLIGSPRNDILYSDEIKIRDIKSALGLPCDKKIILFAPTFRSGGDFNEDINKSGINQLNDIEFDVLFETLNARFGSDWVFVARIHYNVEKYVNWKKLVDKYKGRIINGNSSDDMSEYLACTDVLLTDVSSCMFDFLVTKKPTFIYFPDLDYYSNVERGLYYDIEKLPFPFSKTFDGLIHCIKAFDYQDYLFKIDKLKNEFNIIESSDSSKKVVEFILDDRGLL